MLDQGQAGDNAGLLLRGVERTDIEKVLAAAGSIKPHTKFEAEVYILSKMKVEDTLHSLRLQTSILFRTTDVTGSIEPTELKWLSGDNIKMNVELELKSL